MPLITHSDQLDGLYFVRRMQADGTYWYSCGSGQNATPKLYTLGGARGFLTKELAYEDKLRQQLAASNSPLKLQPDDHPWEMVPVSFNIGPAEHSG